MADETTQAVEETTPAPAVEETAAPAPAVEEKAEVAVPEKFKKLIKEIEEMTVLELSDFIKKFEERYGVTAAAPVAAAAAPAVGAAAAAEAPVEEQTEFTATITEIGPNKIPVIKVVRELTGLGLKEAKDMVDGAPQTVKSGVSKDEAASVKAKLEED